jgi:hypothetical protein
VTQSQRCTATTKAGQPCRAWAVRDSDPPRCAIHLRLARGGAPEGNRNAVRHAFYATFDLDNPDVRPINGIIADLAAKQAQLSAMIDQLLLRADDTGIADLVKLFSLHGQNASRLGRLLRDRLVLSADTANSFDKIMHQALDELSQEWGIDL